MGQYVYGIITIGQFSVGLINISQIGIGMFFSAGQITASCGYAFGQFATGFYIPFCQLGIAFYRVRCGMFGIHYLFPLLFGVQFYECCCSQSKWEEQEKGRKEWHENQAQLESERKRESDLYSAQNRQIEPN